MIGRRVSLLPMFALVACTGTIGERADREPNYAPNDPNNPNSPNNPNNPAAPFIASKTIARRLSQSELDATLKALLGDDTQPARTFLSEDEFAPFDNDYTLQIASAAYVESLDALAEQVANRAVGDAAQRAIFMPCTPSGAADAVCFRRFVESFGSRALRRPLIAEEIDRLTALHAYSIEANPHVATDFYTGVALVIRALLQDPEFLHRVESGAPNADDPTVFALDDYEIASRLSYLLWGTMPDEALFADAAAGRLVTGDGRRAAAERMLLDPRARSQVRRFHAMWLGYRAIPHAAALVSAFNRETTALIDRVVFDEKQSYLELFRARETFVDDALADHYGYARPEDGEGWVAYDDPSRAGILSHGSVLAAFSKFTDTSPTQRGILIRNRLMCQRILSPPPDVDTDRPPPSTGEVVCKKDRYVAHTLSSGCNNCHSQMDPIGFGLEGFDIAGRARAHDDGAPECLIDGQGELPGYGAFRGPRELAEKLITEHFIERCMSQQFYSFAIGRALDPTEDKAVGELVQKLADNGYALDRMIVEYAASAPFATRREGDQ